MSIKSRLEMKAGNLGAQGENPGDVAADRTIPRTAPGQMLAFRQEMLQQTQRLAELEAELEKYNGALVGRLLDPKRVRPSRWANRHQDSFEDAEFKALEQAMLATGGNVSPTKVRPLPPGTEDYDYELVFGNRRHRVCLMNDLPLLAIVEDLTDRELFVQMEHENRERKNPSAWEQGRTYQMALDHGLWPSQNAMAAEIGVSQAHVSRCVAAYALPEVVVQAFDSPNHIQFPWVKDLGALANLDQRVLNERVRAANALKERTPKKIFSILTAGAPAEAIGPTAPAIVSNAVSVMVTGKDIKVVCKKTILSTEQQQKLAELVDDFITAQIRPSEDRS